ncbi:hypothetical protein OHA70_16360 [Kribbella sp. NBC_00382]|uniref:hypothetical protein n=1 Tax=Kribbella sp. NBC_00382 TaxID=2975967 RepID=UPI002E216F94
MTDDQQIIARAAALRLAQEQALGPRLVTEVEQALAADGRSTSPDQYIDPVSIGALIVSIAGLGWTIYTDLRKKSVAPPAPVVARTIRVKYELAPDLDPEVRGRIIEVVAEETVRIGSDSPPLEK